MSTLTDPPLDECEVDVCWALASVYRSGIGMTHCEIDRWIASHLKQQHLPGLIPASVGELVAQHVVQVHFMDIHDIKVPYFTLMRHGHVHTHPHIEACA